MREGDTYSKLVVCGDVIFWYEYDKPPTKARSKKVIQDDFDALNLFDTELRESELKECRKDERRAQTLRDGSNLVRQLALMNFKPEESTFLTLTYREHVDAGDIFYSDDEFKKFFKRLRYHFDEPKVKYLAVRELTKKGRIHYHLLVNSRLGLPSLPDGYGRYKGIDGKTYNNPIAHDYEEKFVLEKENVVSEIWRHGWVDVKPLYGEIDNIGAYLVKYMTKNISLELFPGKNFYLASQGLQRPVSIVGDKADELIQILGLRQKKEVFGNSYITEYQDMCHFKEINLKRSSLLVPV